MAKIINASGNDDSINEKTEFLQLFTNKPTLVLPEELSKLERKRISCLIIIASSPMLTVGNETRLENVTNGLMETEKLNNIRTMYVGYRPKHPLPSQIEILKQISSDVSMSKREVKTIIKSALLTILNQLKPGSTIGFLSAFQSGGDLSCAASLLQHKDIKGVFIGCESSFAYTNEPTVEPLNKRIKRDILERMSYRSNDRITTYFLRPATPYVPVVEVTTHPPNSTYSCSTSIPIAPKIVEKAESLKYKPLKELKESTGNILISKNCAFLAEMLKDPKVINIHLAANEGCFDAKKVGTWWTSEQYQDASNSAKILIRSLYTVSLKTGKVILLAARQSFVNYILRINIPNVHCVNNLPETVPAGLYLTAVPQLSENDHVQYMAANDFVIHRTIQTNSYTKSIYAGIANIIFTIPGKGYMDAEEMDRSATKLHKLLHFTSSSNQEEISKAVMELVLNSSKREELIKNQNVALRKTIDDTRINFFDVVPYIFGLS